MSAVTNAGDPFDVLVIGSGPAGQGAALAASRAGKRAIVIEQDRGVGGACVTHGTIPSKTLRETALAVSNFRRKTGDAFRVDSSGATQVLALMRRLDEVVSAHEQVMTSRLARAAIELRHGRVRFIAEDRVMVRSVRGVETELLARVIIIATGSRPRSPREIPVDHEHVLDSDSILSMAYLPRSLTVVGGGVTACEYASIFAALGVAVTIVDKASGPLGFLDPALSSKFVDAFLAAGGEMRFGSGVGSVSVDPTEGVTVVLNDGTTLLSDKVLVAQGRIANVAGLDLHAIGLTTDPRGLVPVDANGFTGVGKVYAAGDVIGPPSLAASSMEQGRRAVCHALGQPLPTRTADVPTGVYTIPELASIGLTEAQARAKFQNVVIGCARLEEISRGQIAAIDHGMLKLVVEGSTRRVVGVHVCGEGAAELVGIGQVAIASDWEVERFVETTFNYPTLAEAYRVAALDALDAFQKVEGCSAGVANDSQRHVHDARLHHPELLSGSP